jgi:sugar/nucleoside kinase (ribokinase family)
MNILVVGSVALDSIETPFGKVEGILGGSAVHFSCAASFFTQVALVGVVGEDFPREHLDFLREKGVDLRGLKVDAGETFRWKGYYEYDLNQAHTLDTKLNVFEDFRPHLPEEYRNINFVFLANIDPELQKTVLQQAVKPKLTCCDTMNFWIENKPQALMETLKLVDIALMNDSEAREFCKTYSLLDASRKILALGPQAVVFKKGEHGALMFTDSTHFSAPAFPLEEIKDPTGAGDSFAGGFLGHLAKTGELSESNIRKAVIYGSVMASFNVEGFGLDRLRSLTLDEIEERYELFRKITVF